MLKVLTNSEGKKEPCLFQFGFLSQGQIWLLFCFLLGVYWWASFLSESCLKGPGNTHRIPFVNFYFCFKVLGKRATLGSKRGLQRELSGVDEAAAS